MHSVNTLSSPNGMDYLERSAPAHLCLQLDFIHFVVEIFKVSTQVQTKLFDACFSIAHGSVNGVPHGSNGWLHSRKDGKIFRGCGHLILFNELVHLNHRIPFFLQAFDLQRNVVRETQ